MQQGGNRPIVRQMPVGNKPRQQAGHVRDVGEHVLRLGVGGQVVRHKVTPLYEGPRTVPYAFKMQESGWNPDGSPGICINDEILNQFFGLQTGKWHNLGRVSNPGPVPVRGTDAWNGR
ncbi:hypothetical protein [Streptomyces goshikiensis]|uniref:hypothetical protein n=1 Tax=Streptomyces goshikiensis TaxID=1942 RepID=UPI0033BB67A8